MPELISAVNLTRELIRIPSESSGQTATSEKTPENGIVARLEVLCRETGMTGERQEALPGRDNFLIHFPCPGKPKLLIICHMDTVSGDSMEEPFSGDLREGRIYGRGSCDDKGPLAAALATLANLHLEGIALQYDLLFAATVDEECSMAGAVQLAAGLDGWDLCIGLEPTGLRVITAHKGVYRFRVRTFGRAAHSSEPDKGENAVQAMLPILADIQEFGRELAERQDHLMGRASLAITEIHGGTSLNIIPDCCQAGVDIRLLPGMESADIRELMEALVGTRGTIDEVYQGSGISTDAATPLVQKFMNILAREGRNADPTTAAFATDCSKMAHKGPCIVWGPGSIEQAHKREEFIEVSQLEAAGAVLRRFLTES